jgi:hypothetical protein
MPSVSQICRIIFAHILVISRCFHSFRDTQQFSVTQTRVWQVICIILLLCFRLILFSAFPDSTRRNQMFHWICLSQCNGRFVDVTTSRSCALIYRLCCPSLSALTRYRLYVLHRCQHSEEEGKKYFAFITQNEENFPQRNNIFSLFWVTLKWFWLVNGFIDHLSTHDSRIHFTDHCHTQTIVLNILQSPIAVSWQRSFNTGTTTVSLNYTLQILYMKSFLHSRPFKWAPLKITSCPKTVLVKTSWNGPHRKHRFSVVPLLRLCLLLRERVYRAVAPKRLWYICLSHGRCIITALHVTIVWEYLRTSCSGEYRDPRQIK